jgi:hypothetical protein
MVVNLAADNLLTLNRSGNPKYSVSSFMAGTAIFFPWHFILQVSCVPNLALILIYP